MLGGMRCCWVLYNLLVISVKQCGTVRWEANPDSAVRVGDRIVAVDQSVGKGLTACSKFVESRLGALFVWGYVNTEANILQF